MLTGVTGNPGPKWGRGDDTRPARQFGRERFKISRSPDQQLRRIRSGDSCVRNIGETSKKKTDAVEVTVKMDSELVVKQMKGQYKVKHPVLKEQHARLKKVIEQFGVVSFNHVFRAENSDADALANEAMDRGT